MSQADDIRDVLGSDDEDEFVPATILIDGPEEAPEGERRFLGMSAGERALLSVLLFVASLLLGAGVRIVTGRIVL